MSDSDSVAAVQKTPPKGLAALFAAGAEQQRLWRPEELGAIFRHQLAAPILVDLGGFDPGTAGRLKNLCEAHSLVLKSFSDLFQHNVPPVELLNLTKEFAKANKDHPESSLPQEIASALYFASIATALVRLNTRITHLGDADLARGFNWLKEQPWIDGQMRALMEAALGKLNSSQTGPK